MGEAGEEDMDSVTVADMDSVTVADMDSVTVADTDSVTVAAISIATFVIGLIFGMVVVAVVLIKYPKFYRTLARCVRPKTEPGDVLVVDGHSKGDPAARSNYQYSEINENNTQTFARQLGQGNNTVSFSVREGYTQCKINGQQQQKYSTVMLAGGKETQGNSYEPVTVQHNTNNKNKNRTSGPIYHILEPCSNKRLPVKPLQIEMLKEDHVYFKLEPGSNKVVQVPRTVVNVAYGSRDFTSDDLIYFVLDNANVRESTCSAEPYAVNELHSPHYTLEIGDN